MKSIIFDVDGTLWDATPVAAKAWTRACMNAGLPYSHLTKERMQAEFGKKMDDIALSLVRGVPRETSIAVGEEAIRIEDGLLRAETPEIYPGVREVFETLHERGIPVVIVSNCQAGYIEILIESHGLVPYVSGHLCYGDTGEGKPYNILESIRRFRLQDPVYVGDTAGDMAASLEAGIPFVFASYGYGEAESPDWRINRPLDLLNLL